MGRGSSGIGAGKGTGNTGSTGKTGVEAAAPEQRRTLCSKSQVGELTKDYTPEQFLGDSSTWTGTVDDARSLAESNMPKSLEIGGYTFKSMGAPDARFVSDGQLKNNVVVMMDYQSTEKVGNEYPVIQIGVRIRRYRGKIQTEIVRDNPLYGTKFW